MEAARELYRILVAGGGDAACRFVRELAAGLENERKTTLVRMPQAEIEVAGAKAKSEVAAAIAADLAERAENALIATCRGPRLRSERRRNGIVHAALGRTTAGWCRKQEAAVS